MVEVSLTVGKLDASLALLLTKDHHLIEFPTILLPDGVRAGSIIKIKCEQDLDGEKEEANEFQRVQDEILNTFGKNLPQAPKLKVKNVTQTSCVLEWDPLDLGTASLKNLILYRDGKKLGTIPQPLTNKTTKLSGLPIDKTFKFQLRLDTSAGTYLSDVVEVTTHKMTDLSGITVCLGDISPNEQFTIDDVKETLKVMGAHYPPQTKVKVDTTHFVCTRENKQNEEYLKAAEMNIPIIRPEWLKACEREKRIVGVRDFYVKDCVLPEILAKNYWRKGDNDTHLPVPPKDTPNGDAHAETEDVPGSSKQEDSPALENGASEVTADNNPTIEETTAEEKSNEKQNDQELANDVLNTADDSPSGELNEKTTASTVSQNDPVSVKESSAHEPEPISGEVAEAKSDSASKDTETHADEKISTTEDPSTAAKEDVEVEAENSVESSSNLENAQADQQQSGAQKEMVENEESEKKTDDVSPEQPEGEETTSQTQTADEEVSNEKIVESSNKGSPSKKKNKKKNKKK